MKILKINLLLVSTLLILAAAGTNEKSEKNTVVSCNGNVTLISQAEVNAFQCTEILGDLTISGANITNLHTLDKLTKVTGVIRIIDNPVLKQLNDFSKLRQPVSGIEIARNASLVSINGFNALDSIMGQGSEITRLRINDNRALQEINGFTSLQAILTPPLLKVDFSIAGNEKLKMIKGFSSLNAILGAFLDFSIADNPKLESLQGFSSLSSLSGGIDVKFDISNNRSLPDLDGFSSLTRVGAANAIITIVGNKSLKNLDGLSALTGFGARSGSATIKDNAKLERCCGVYPLLSITRPPSFPPYVFNISNNRAGCTVEDILANGPCLNFEANQRTVCVNDIVIFTTGSKSADLKWNFGEGADPASANGKGPFTVKYSTPGNKTISVSAHGSPASTRENYITVNPLPLDKFFFPEFRLVCPEYATNIIVLKYEPDIMYLLRKDVDNSAVAGPWPGTVGLYTGALTTTTTYNVLATNPATGCQAVMIEKPTVTVTNRPLDKKVVAEYPLLPPGQATNIIVLDGQPDVLYLLRNDENDETVAGPSPATIGLYSGSLYKTTTFKVIANIDNSFGCETEMLTKVTVTVDSTLTQGGTASASALGGDDSNSAFSNELTISPNPGKGFFEVKIQNQVSGQFQFDVYNFMGNLVWEEKFMKSDQWLQMRMNVEGWNPGIYVLSVRYLGDVKNELYAQKRLVISE